MPRFRPRHGLLLLAIVITAIFAADFALNRRVGQGKATRVSPDSTGKVRIEVADLAPVEVRYYLFLNAGNQEVRFFVGRDENRTVQVAFDAAESDFKLKRGFRHENGWMVNNKCETTCRLSEVNDNRGGCRPVALPHKLEGTTLVLDEGDILAGWRLFR